MEGVFGEWVATRLFGLGGLLGCGEKEEIAGLAFFIQGEDEGRQNWELRTSNAIRVRDQARMPEVFDDDHPGQFSLFCRSGLLKGLCPRQIIPGIGIVGVDPQGLIKLLHRV